MPGFWITFVSNIYSLDLQSKKRVKSRSQGQERQLLRVVRRELRSTPSSFKSGKRWKEVINNFIKSLRKVNDIDKETYQANTHVSQFLGREIMGLKMKLLLCFI